MMMLDNAPLPSRLTTDWLNLSEKSPGSQYARRAREIPGGLPIQVEACHLKKNYGRHLAVKDISFSIQGGEVLGLLGPNGAGKSTCMMMLAGLLDPTSGEILLNGQKFDGRNLEQRRLFGIVPQEYAIYEELSAVDNLKFFGKLYGIHGQSLKARYEEVLDEIGLTESGRRPANTYSGGMKRRLNFGIALMHKPMVLILDEPTLGVDPQSRMHLMDCIHQQTAAGGCVVYASHYMEEAQAICNRVVILDRGEVLMNDSIRHLLDGSTADLYLYVDRITGIAEELEGLARIGVGSDNEPAVIVSGNSQLTKKDLEIFPGQNGFDASDAGIGERAPDIGSRLQLTLRELRKLGIRVLSIETRKSSLEQLFLEMTGKQLRD